MTIEEAVARDPLMRRMAALCSWLPYANLLFLICFLSYVWFADPRRPDPAHGYVYDVKVETQVLYLNGFEIVLLLSVLLGSMAAFGLAWLGIKWIWRSKWRQIEAEPAKSHSQI